YVIEAIEDKPVDIYFKDNLDKYYLNYDYKRDKLYVKSGLIIAESGRDYKITAASQDGEKITEYITPVKYEQNNSDTDTISSSEEKILKENKIAYLKVKSMSSRTLESDGKKIIEFFNKIKDYSYLIIDIRGNGGGTDDYWQSNIVEPLISEPKSESIAMAYKGNYIKPFLTGRGIITKPIDKIPEQFKSNYVSDMEQFSAGTKIVKPRNSVNFKGKVYLLTDDRVYSSSESFAAFCKASGFAELVGTTTGGDGIGIDPCVMALPSSGLVIRFSLDMGINSDGTVNEKTHTKPDIYAEPAYEDFLKGRDTILNKVLELCNK
ncbi:MAG: S41 family peptidase, partial [Clostridiaceae bacterium]